MAASFLDFDVLIVVFTVLLFHYSGVIMNAMASHITSLTIVYSTVYSGADQRKHQSSASLTSVRGIHRRPVNFPHKWPVTRKCFREMTSSCWLSMCSGFTVRIIVANFWAQSHGLFICSTSTHWEPSKMASFSRRYFRMNFHVWMPLYLYSISLKFVPKGAIDSKSTWV